MDNSAASDTARNETADSLGEPIKLSSVTETYNKGVEGAT